MSRDEKIDYKGFANQMRQNACRNAEGNIVCSEELWELIASTVEAKPADVAEEIFAEIDKLLAVDSNGEANLDVRALQRVKKKYTEEKING